MSDPQTETIDYRKVIVKKPWGYEYLMYENGTVALWYLCIEPGKRTSLHCHPRKKTGLVLLHGEATLSFLTDSITLKPVGRSMIRPGLFHSTAATSADEAVLLEIETPCDKGNLVRLEDQYGRKGKSYEGVEAIITSAETTLRLGEPLEGQPRQHTLHGCVLSMEKTSDLGQFAKRDPSELIAVLAGGLMSDAGEPILGPGDIVNTPTIARLSDSFTAPHGMSFLAVRKGS